MIDKIMEDFEDRFEPFEVYTIPVDSLKAFLRKVLEEAVEHCVEKHTFMMREEQKRLTLNEEEVFNLIKKASYIRGKYDDNLDTNDRREYEEELSVIVKEICKLQGGN